MELHVTYHSFSFVNQVSCWLFNTCGGPCKRCCIGHWTFLWGFYMVPCTLSPKPCHEITLPAERDFVSRSFNGVICPRWQEVALRVNSVRPMWRVLRDGNLQVLGQHFPPWACGSWVCARVLRVRWSFQERSEQDRFVRRVSLPVTTAN